MNISEDTFISWSKGPSDTETAKCGHAETAVRKAIDADSDLQDLDITVFPQGSFRARTNVPGDSDVDVCIRCSDSFIADYPPGKTREDFGNTTAPLTFADYRKMVEKALRNYFGSAQVDRGDKAFDVRENTYRIDADVIATFEHRRYTGRINPDGSDHYLSGVAFRPDSGGTIKNWPQQNYDNGVAKNDVCNRHYKRVVRILKRLCYKMRDDGIAEAKDIGSFLIECLVWNAPKEAFTHDTYTSDVRSVLAHTFNNTLDDERCKEWGEVNELKYLFRDGQPWTRQQAHTFLSAAWNYIGYK